MSTDHSESKPSAGFLRFLSNHKRLILIPLGITILFWVVLLVLSENWGDAPFLYAIF